MPQKLFAKSGISEMNQWGSLDIPYLSHNRGGKKFKVCQESVVSETAFIYESNRVSLFKYWNEIVQMHSLNIQLTAEKKEIQISKEEKKLAQKILLEHSVFSMKKYLQCNLRG